MLLRFKFRKASLPNYRRHIMGSTLLIKQYTFLYISELILRLYALDECIGLKTDK
jgi:hypothetical protein